MIYQFQCSCHESRQFQLEIDADSSHSFFDLHQLLQSTLGFQNLNMASFSIPRSLGRQKIEISQFDGQHTPTILSMHSTLIGDMLKPGIRLIRYVFDMMNDRYLQIQLTGIIMEKNLREPMVRLNRGEAPAQEMDEVITDDLYEKIVEKKNNSDYGVLTDYYEIFGEMEEYVL